MLYCNLQVLLCGEIAAQDFATPPNMTSGGTSGGGAKKFYRLAIARHILHLSHTLWYNSTTAPDGLLVGSEWCPIPIPLPARRLWHLDPRRLRCLKLGPPTFQTKVTPLAQGLPPAKSDLTCVDVTSRLLRALLLTRLTGLILYTGPPV